VSTNQIPDSFDAYWDAIDAELARYDAAPELELLPLRTTPFANFYAVRLTSIGPYRIFGFYSVPNGEGPFPGLLYTPRYGSVNNPPHYDDRQRYAVLTLMHRGQRLADQPFAASYPGLLTLGIESPETYIYRGILADCLRGAEFLLSRPEVDRERVGIIGDDLALITAARRPQFRAARIDSLMFYRALEASAQVGDYPLEEFNDHLRGAPEQREAVAHTLAHFDARYHAPHITANLLLSVNDPQAVNGPEWQEPLHRALGGRAETYQLTHEGGTDHDCLEAWMARQLGVEPKSRLWSTAPATP